MALTPLALKVMSSEEVLFEGPVLMVVMPGSEGQLGVLWGHTPFIVQLQEGAIDLYEHSDTKVSQSLSIQSGFAHIQPEKCTILVT